MTLSRPLHVLVAGGGLAGLAVAQGVLKSGHTVDVFERDADLDRKQGYYLHFNALGGGALRRVLPDDLYEVYLDTSRQSYRRIESIVLNDQLEELSSQPSLYQPPAGPRRDTGVHRRTLRQILSARLGDRLHTGSAVAGFEQDADGVTAVLVDGSTVRGDVLVGADGIRSAVRTQLMPEVPVIPTGVKGIGVYGRTPLTPELDAQLPEILDQGVLMAIDRKGTRLLMASFRPRRSASESVAERAPDIQVDDVPAYMMVSCSVSPGTVVPSAPDWTAETPVELRDSMLRTLEDWHPAARAVVAGLDLDSMFAIPFGYLEPAETWKPSRVTVVGDAAHGMLPTLGMGANLSLNDAAMLVDALDAASRDEAEITEAIGSYETQMRDMAYPILRKTVDHDKHFGGGTLADAGQRAADGS